MLDQQIKVKYLHKLTYLLMNDVHLIQNHRKFAEILELDDVTFFQLVKQCNRGTLNIYELIRTVLEYWLSSNGRNATFKKLCDHLIEGGFIRGADDLVEFSIEIGQLNSQIASLLLFAPPQNIHESLENFILEETPKPIVSSANNSKENGPKTNDSNELTTSSPSINLTTPPNYDWLEKMTVKKLIGFGAFGNVFQIDSDGRQSALKIIFPLYESKETEERDKQKFQQEYKNIQGKDHVNIVKCLNYAYDNFESSVLKKFLPAVENVDSDAAEDCKIKKEILDLFETKIKLINMKSGVDVMFIEMELCGQSLRSWLIDVADGKKNPSDETRAKIGQGIISGLKFLHSHNVIHRDLKPENIFFAHDDPSTVKIGDFGLCREVESPKSAVLTKKIGTYEYQAPEVRRGELYGYQADYYALGLVLWEVFQILKFEERTSYFDELVVMCQYGLIDENKLVVNLKTLIIKLTKHRKSERLQPSENIDLQLVANAESTENDDDDIDLC